MINIWYINDYVCKVSIGTSGCWENYIAEKIFPMILPKKNTVVLAFADHLKINCITKHGADFDKVYGKKTTRLANYYK